MNEIRHEDWLDFAEAAWSAAGRPESLGPHLVDADPVRYDAAYYDYFERRYFDLWLSVFSRVKPDGRLTKHEAAEFREAWRRNFSWETTWKQLLPLFVYSGLLGVSNEVVIELGSLYVLAQAVPSMVIDRILDEGTSPATTSDAAFCLTAYIKGLAGIRQLKLPSSSALENCLISHTQTMYTSMLIEYERRFVLPPPGLSDTIGDYFGPTSRLLSSIFFGVLPRWAFILAGATIPPSIEESLDALRMVRQLNDELSDIEQDLSQGLLTLPWLYALEEAPQLRGLIDSYWRRRDSSGERDACLQCLGSTKGVQRAWSKASNLLSSSMAATATIFPANEAFELTVLHNVRRAHLMRIAQNSYRDVPTPRQPSLPLHRLASNQNPIVPIGGAGTVVFDDQGRVLMSLILKRGMLRWELPAGVAKDGETMEQAAHRETYEETGRSVELGGVIALCWHYSRELGKGWMGTFFGGQVREQESGSFFRVINAVGLGMNKINIATAPHLYDRVPAEECDFAVLHRELMERQLVRPTAHENVVASGFVDWTRIPAGRMHPLHRELLEAQRLNEKIDLLVRDADTDQQVYDPHSQLYVTASKVKA